jgi:hypothetical protein
MLGVGLAAVFATNNGAGSAALVSVGVVLLLLAALGNRIQVIELGGAKLTLRDLANQRLALADEKEAAGDHPAATDLRRQGLALARLANEYAHQRRRMRSGPRRTAILEDIISQLGELAQEHQFDPVAVWEWFDRGKPEARITAIGLMHGDKNLRDPFVALSAIEASKSAFEQFHGLRLAHEMLPDLSPLERKWVRDTVLKARDGGRFKDDSDRWRMSDAILQRLQE